MQTGPTTPQYHQPGQGSSPGFDADFKDMLGPTLEAERGSFRRFFEKLGFTFHDRIEIVKAEGTTRHEEVVHGSGIYSVKAGDFPENIAAFVAIHPELRIQGISGDGFGVYGSNSSFLISTRPANPGENPQHVIRIKGGAWPENLIEFKNELPDYKVGPITGDGNGTYGSNDYFIAIVQQLSPRELDR